MVTINENEMLFALYAINRKLSFTLQYLCDSGSSCLEVTDKSHDKLQKLYVKERTEHKSKLHTKERTE